MEREEDRIIPVVLHEKTKMMCTAQLVEANANVITPSVEINVPYRVTRQTT